MKLLEILLYKSEEKNDFTLDYDSSEIIVLDTFYRIYLIYNSVLRPEMEFGTDDVQAELKFS